MEALQQFNSSDLLGAWLESVSSTTVRLYRGDLRDFAAYVGLQNASEIAGWMAGLDSGTANTVALRWRRSLSERSLAPSTINRRMSALRSYTKLGQQTGIFSFHISVPGVKQALVRDVSGVSREDFSSAIKKLEERGDLRGVVAIRLMHDSALRLKEVAGVRFPEDVDLEGKRVAVVRKGYTVKTWKALSGATVEAIKDWEVQRGSQPGFLISSRGSAEKGLSTSRIRKMLSPLGLSPQRIRHLAITTAAEMSNGNILAVQSFAGHADASTTQRYIDASCKARDERRLTELVSG